MSYFHPKSQALRRESFEHNHLIYGNFLEYFGRKVQFAHRHKNSQLEFW
jgi:hypothetical protein